MPSHHSSYMRTAVCLYALPFLIDATPSFDCSNIVSQKVRWNLKPLGGPRAVHWDQPGSPASHNYTFTLDICKPLRKFKDIPSADQCATQTRVCGVESVTNTYDNSTVVEKVVDIAGDYTTKTGVPLDSKVYRLKDAPGTDHDSDKTGIRVELSGGSYPLEKGGTPQKAIIDFLCDANTDGTETEMPTPGDEDDKDDKLRRREDGPKTGVSPLKFRSYKDEEVDGKETGVLRLDWITKFACEDALDKLPSTASHWGFFTSFLIFVFLAIAAYLIFGSWLNYNRYGARGWDLLPHGDAIRDVPYILKDIGRKVANTVQGPGTRGGYSAV